MGGRGRWERICFVMMIPEPPDPFSTPSPQCTAAFACKWCRAHACGWFSSMRNSGRGGAESWTGGGKTPAPVQAGTTVKHLGKEKLGGLGSGPSWTWATNLCSWQRQQTVSWAAQGSVGSRPGRWSCLSAQPHPAAMPGPAPLGWAGLEGASCPHKRLCT